MLTEQPRIRSIFYRKVQYIQNPELIGTLDSKTPASCSVQHVLMQELYE